MMRAWGWVAVPAMASTLMACSLLKKPGAADAGSDAEPSSGLPVEAAAATEAVNESELTRYPDEKPIDHATLTAESGGNLRTQAGPGGDLVIVLKHGTEVQKIAEHASYYLVIADDPKDPTRKLMGWAAESVFSGEGPHRHEGDAGMTPVRVGDAGARPPAAGVDGGKPAPPTPSKPLDVKKINGACPSGYAPCSAICRATCKTDPDCGEPAAHCTAGFCLGPGASVCK
jgi:hypothetical protein